MRDTMVLFTRSSDSAELKRRIKSLPDHLFGEYFDYYTVEGSVLGVDSSGDVVDEYDEEELSAIEAALGEFETITVEYDDESGRDSFLRKVLPGLHGILDTNYGEILSYRDVLQWVTEHPGLHFRRLRSGEP